MDSCEHIGFIYGVTKLNDDRKGLVTFQDDSMLNEDYRANTALRDYRIALTRLKEKAGSWKLLREEQRD